MTKLKIEKAGSLSKYERQKRKDCIRKVLLLTNLYATWQKLADYQYQRLGSFYIQRLLIQNLLWQHENSKEEGPLLVSERKFGAWILLTLINWQKRITL